jgi:hypothetical protein
VHARWSTVGLQFRGPITEKPPRRVRLGRWGAADHPQDRADKSSDPKTYCCHRLNLLNPRKINSLDLPNF